MPSVCVCMCVCLCVCVCVCVCACVSVCGGVVPHVGVKSDSGEVLSCRPRKVLVLGSGGLSIGQAGEFDYSGSQVSSW